MEPARCDALVLPMMRNWGKNDCARALGKWWGRGNEEMRQCERVGGGEAQAARHKRRQKQEAMSMSINTNFEQDAQEARSKTQTACSTSSRSSFRAARAAGETAGGRAAEATTAAQQQQHRTPTATSAYTRKSARINESTTKTWRPEEAVCCWLTQSGVGGRFGTSTCATSSRYIAAHAILLQNGNPGLIWVGFEVGQAMVSWY
eukprot:339316-Rhodomonas_salina.3